MTDEKANISGYTLEEVFERGEAIYDAKYRESYERDHMGMLVAIDIRSQRAYLGTTSGEALVAARKDSPHGVFHLMRVRHKTAFKMLKRGCHA